MKAARGGFTLIELLVVITIIGLIVGLVVANLNSAKIKARDTQRVANVADMRKALDLYINQTGAYPIVAADTCLTGADSVETALIAANILTKAVADPVSPTDPAYCYLYQANPGGGNYSIQYYLETGGAAGAQGTHTVTN